VSVDARREAFERVGGRFDVRVLEPSPPAVREPPWQACDPVAMQPRRAGLPLLSPVENGDLTWDELARGEPELSSWCADRWLGAWRRLRPVVDLDELVTTRQSWHALAEQVLAPARRHANGKIGLRYTRDGFGTPFFGADRQARVEGGDVVVVADGVEHREPISTIAAAARLVGVEAGAPADLYDPTTDLASDAPLVVHEGAPRLLADWYGFACSVLEEIRAATNGTDTRTQLWPEHFDLSIDLGDDQAGTRGTFGASPGDAAQPEPYLYVTHWKDDVPPDPFWNETAFAGASLAYATLLGVNGQRSTALDFFRTGLAVLGVSAT
jgi:hypothetical protein